MMRWAEAIASNTTRISVPTACVAGTSMRWFERYLSLQRERNLGKLDHVIG